MDPNDSDPIPELTPDEGPEESPLRRWLPVVGFVLLAGSLAGNAALWWKLRSASAPTDPQTTVVVPARPPECAPCPACEDASVACPSCPVCETCPTVAEHRRDGGTAPSGHRVDTALAAQGEGHVAGAEDAGERDPVQLRAQRTMVTGVDQIVASRSPAAAERFLQRNLPSIASMDCAFRDPAMAEHVRMQLRPLNQLARPNRRLSEADLLRYERELRCPRE